MKPVAIVRHYHSEGPGYFAIWLERAGVPWRLVRIDAGEALPREPREFAGLAFMGGPMSVNDPLPWIGEACELIRRSVAADVPVLGHCLGGQLMAKALGAAVGPMVAKEIGWGEAQVAASDEAERWLGVRAAAVTVFHWHGESFGIPRDGVRLMSTPLCENQAFALGRHLALQCHVEMTAELVESWCRSGAAEIAASPGAGVQPPEQIQRDLDVRLASLHALADRIYGCWARGLAG